MEFAIIGYGVVLVMMYLLMKSKTSPIALFIILPIIGALIGGFGVKEIDIFIKKGMGMVTNNAIMFCFSVVYFNIMNAVGIFDPIVDYLVAKAGNNVVAVTMAASIIGIISHLDGASATTVLVTIPAMWPIFKRMNISAEALLLILSGSLGVMNMLPWGGPTARVAAVTGLDMNYLWIRMIPTQIFGAIATIFMSALIGMYEKKRGAGYIANVEGVDGEACKEKKSFTPKVAVNFILTLALLGVLSWGKIMAYTAFMVALSIALVFNYKDLKEQEDVVKKNCVAGFMMVAVMLASGVFVGILNFTPMIKQMAIAIVQIVPVPLERWLHIIIGVLTPFIGMVIGADAYYYGITPLVIEICKNFGINAESVGFTALLGKNVALLISPMNPSTWLALGLTGIGIREHIKYSTGPIFLLTAATIGFAVITGVIQV